MHPDPAERALEYDFSEKLSGVSDGAMKPYRAVFSDLDLNTHVNNAVYIRWIGDSLPILPQQNLQPLRLRAIFRRQAVVGDKIEVITRQETQEDCIVFQQEVRRGSEVLMTAEQVWV